MHLTHRGIWTHTLDLVPATQAVEIVSELEALGFGAVWLPEVAGRDPLIGAAMYLGGTERIVLATGIASIYARDGLATASAHRTLTEAFPDRFVLGLGVSHAPAVEGLRHHQYRPPLAAMREYLDEMDAAPYFSAAPTSDPVRVLAALGPKMLDLAAARAAGAHPYFVSVEHTAIARRRLGPDALLAPEQKVVFESDPEVARTIARTAMAVYLGLPNYTNNLRRLGFTDDDLADGGSDRLVDAIVAWGDDEAIAARLRAHQAAGADHVAVQVLTGDLTTLPLPQWRRLATLD
jgi:probable F420-dependent oxidoreductase